MSQADDDDRMVAIITGSQIAANYFILFPGDIVLSVVAAITAGAIIRVGLLFIRAWSK